MKTTIAIALLGLLGAHAAAAEEFDHRITLNQTSAATFYVDGEIAGYGPVSMLVDTGSTYSAIDEKTLAKLKAGGNATYLRSLNGMMADGSKLKVSVYRISGLTLGGECMIHDVEAAVFPGQTRPILGLSALHRVSPFIFSTNPPGLALSNCLRVGDGKDAVADAAKAGKPDLPKAAAAEVAVASEATETAQTSK